MRMSSPNYWGEKKRLQEATVMTELQKEETKISVVLANDEGTVGFVHIENFKGATAKLSLENLKKGVKMLEDFKDKGLTPPALTLGIGLAGLIMFFLDSDQKVGIAIAPLLEEVAEDE